MNRRDFMRRGVMLVATVPLGINALMQEPVEEEEHEEFVEVLDQFEDRIVYTKEPFNNMLAAIRQSQQAIAELRDSVADARKAFGA